MSTDERGALQARLAQMRSLHHRLSELHAGVCVLHLGAAIDTLESHLRRDGRPAIESLHGAGPQQAAL